MTARKSWCAAMARRRSTALAWNAKGTLLALSDEEGDAGIFPL